jgi:hypothetical protein
MFYFVKRGMLAWGGTRLASALTLEGVARTFHFKRLLAAWGAFCGEG